MYYKNRAEAGKKLAEKLAKYSSEKTIIIAINDGAVVVSAPIAKQLRCGIAVLTTRAIALPGEDQPVGYINQSGDFVYNKLLSEGQRDEIVGEYRTFLEQEKTEQLRTMNALVGGEDVIFDHNKLHGFNIILVSDGLSSGPLLDSITEYLKPVRVNKLIIALPIACITTVDRLHMYADELCVLGVAKYFLGTDHYYEDNTIPNHETIMNAVSAISSEWGP